ATGRPGGVLARVYLIASAPANASATVTGSGAIAAGAGWGGSLLKKLKGTDAPAARPSAAVTWSRTAAWAPAQGSGRPLAGGGDRDDVGGWSGAPDGRD